MIITLKSGTKLRVRRVPPFAVLQITGRSTPPPVPVVEIETAAGRERVRAQPGTPEWERYVEEVERYNRETNAAVQAFVSDYGVEAWQYPNDSPDVWHTEPPDDWTVPEVLHRHGLASSGIRRVDYINYELLADAADYVAFMAAALGETAPLAPEEVEAALRGFRG